MSAVDGRIGARAPALSEDGIQALHAAHLKRQKRQRLQVFSVQIAILLLFFALWEIAGRLKWIDVLLFSYPSKVFAQIGKDAANGELWGHLGITVGETVVGFVLGTLLGTLIAVLIWWSPFLSKVLDPYMVVFNSMPKVALGPIFIVMFGAGFLSITVTTLSITVIVTTLVVYNSFSDQGGARFRRHKDAGVPKSDFARILSYDYIHAESQRGHGLGRRHRRRVPGGENGARLLDHLRLSGVQFYACAV